MRVARSSVASCWRCVTLRHAEPMAADMRLAAVTCRRRTSTRFCSSGDSRGGGAGRRLSSAQLRALPKSSVARRWRISTKSADTMRSGLPASEMCARCGSCASHPGTVSIQLCAMLRRCRPAQRSTPRGMPVRPRLTSARSRIPCARSMQANRRSPKLAMRVGCQLPGSPELISVKRATCPMRMSRSMLAGMRGICSMLSSCRMSGGATIATTPVSDTSPCPCFAVATSAANGGAPQCSSFLAISTCVSQGASNATSQPSSGPGCKVSDDFDSPYSASSATMLAMALCLGDTINIDFGSTRRLRTRRRGSECICGGCSPSLLDGFISCQSFCCVSVEPSNSKS
ncbi:hypothetical protein GGF47_001298 [Coemansia sp. RSA 2524]|nr:hypothetical protein GGF47_001298 [Coemansia sp. RSA 2524]